MISRRNLLCAAVGAVGAAGLSVIVKQAPEIDLDVAELRRMLPGLDLILPDSVGDELPTDIPPPEAEMAAMRRRFADIELALLGAKIEAISVEQHELLLRWLDALHVYAATRIASGISPWAPNLYEGSTEFLDKHREEWDGGLTEVVQQQADR